MHIIRAITAAMAVGSCGDEVVITEQCLELDDPDAECPVGVEAEEALATDGTATLLERYPARTLEQDGQTYELPAECCYQVETVEPAAQFPSRCGMGRPYVVGGAARVAALRPTGVPSGWERATKRGDVADRREGFSSLDDVTRSLLAERWRTRGSLEHASVASFAQFTLDLMAVGAPASLVRDALAAGISEVRHAELCFELAREIDGKTVAPGALSPGKPDVHVSKEALTARLFHEGCVEETLGALELADRELATTEPRIAAVLARLVADEMKHAALAWRALAWLCRDSACREVLRRELAVAEARFEAAQSAPAEEVDHPALVAMGEPRSGQLLIDLRRAFDEVVRPSAERLLRAGSHAS